MGKNLALNMADNGYRVCVYNRTTSNEFLLQGINQWFKCRIKVERILIQVEVSISNQNF